MRQATQSVGEQGTGYEQTTIANGVCGGCHAHMAPSARFCRECGVPRSSEDGTAPHRGANQLAAAPAPHQSSSIAAHKQRPRRVSFGPWWASTGFAFSIFALILRAAGVETSFGRGITSPGLLVVAGIFAAAWVVIPGPKVKTCPNCDGTKLSSISLSRLMKCADCKQSVAPIVG